MHNFGIFCSIKFSCTVGSYVRVKYWSADCWNQDPHQRPSFKDILAELEEIQKDSIFDASQPESFMSMKDGWQVEIEQIFEDLRLEERVGCYSLSITIIHWVTNKNLLIKYTYITKRV